MAKSTRSRAWTGREKILLIGLLVAASVGMVLFCFLLLDSTETTGLASQKSTPRSINEELLAPVEFGSTSHTEMGFEVLPEFESFFERSVALYTMLARAEQDQLLGLWDQSMEIESNNYRLDTQIAIIRRLSSTAPVVALNRALTVPRLQRGPILSGVFQEWSQIDLAAAIAGATSLDGTERRTALRAILQFRDDLTENKRREVAEQLGLGDTFLRLLSEETALQSNNRPSDAWNHVVNDEWNDSSQLTVLTEIAQAWYQQDGLQVLSHMSRSFSSPHDRNAFHEIVAPIIVSNPQGVLDFIGNLPQEERDPLTTATFLTWSSTDPQAALNAISLFEKNVSLRKSIQREIVHIWATRDPDGILEQIELLPDGLKMHGIETAIARTTLKSPEKALRLMAEMEEFLGNNSRVVTRIVTEWSQIDPRSASDWIVSGFEGTNTERHHLLKISLSHLSLNDPHYAMEIALDQPVDSNGRGLELEVVSELSSTGRAEDAIELLASVRGGSAKVSALVAVGTGFVRQDSPEDALEIASRVPENFKWYFYNEVFRAWAGSAPKQLLETLERLESDEVKSRAGMQLLIANRSNSALTNEEIGFVKTFLSKEDAEKAARLEMD